MKEHFEVNVAPIQIQMTYQIYKAVMEFFFPDKNVDMDDGKEDLNWRLFIQTMLALDQFKTTQTSYSKL